MATRKRTIPRVPEADTESIVGSVREYLQNRSMRERSEYHEGTIKKNLLALIDAVGEEVAANKKVIELGEALPYRAYKNGEGINKTVVGIERRERVTQSLDEDRTIMLLRKKDLFKKCTIETFIIDEDAILAANYDGEITDEELAALYNEKVTPAFYLTEE